ncbi:ABC transporter ATP-binding protein [Caldicellulosiruptoraceae bacterium PP1]
MKRFRNNRLIRLFSFMWKDKSNPFLGILYIFSALFVAAESLIFNYIFSIGLMYITQGAVEKNYKILLDGVLFMIKLMLIVLLIAPFISYIYQYCIRKTTIIIRKNLFEHILNLPMSIFEQKHSADIISRINNDVNVAENAYSWQIMVLFSAFFTGIGGSIIIATANWKLFLYVVFIGLLSAGVNTLFFKPIQKISNQIQEGYSKVSQRFSDIIAGNQVIKIFNIGSIIFQKFVDMNTFVLRLSLRRVKFNATLNALNTFLGFFSFFGAVIIGGIMIINKEFTMAKLLLCINLMGGVMWMFGSIGNFITMIQTSLAGASRIFEILDMDIEENNKKLNERDLNAKENIIKFEGISFSYNNSDYVFDNINFSIPQNSIVAFVGSSGAGKSTLFKLILRFYKPSKGKIYLFNKEISEYSLEQLRDIISYVPQESFLFNGTILENIGYGKENATKEEIIEAAKLAYAHDFIMNLPNGYDTVVGERGALLSGGQRQRIAIARALLKNSPILLLDEATSSLDSESESLVQEALNNLMKGKTTLVIAHRLSTIKNADIIYVIDDGKIIEQGTHDELIEKSGKYQYFYKMMAANTVS